MVDVERKPNKKGPKKKVILSPAFKEAAILAGYDPDLVEYGILSHDQDQEPNGEKKATPFSFTQIPPF